MINVIGLGYIGLPTALTLATGGLDVVGTDKNEELVKTLQKGSLTFEEKGLLELFESANGKNIKYCLSAVPADIYIVAVPTPYDSKTKKIDTKFVENAILDILTVCPQNAIIAVESTISPGTMERVIKPLIEKNGFVCGKDIHIAHVPERIIPGNMVYELEHNNRTIGVDSQEIGNRLIETYSSFCKGKMVVTSMKVAEMTKVVENTSRDINIAFANELARICHSEKIDVYEVIKIANMHPRVQILTPGPGVGGHCISVDPWFLVGDHPDIVDIIMAARRVNDDQPAYILNRTKEIMAQFSINSLSDVGFYGLTYKEDVDDTRESPTLQLLHQMESHLAFGAKVYDPYITKDIVPNQYHDFEEFLSEIMIVVIMVSHKHLIDNQTLLSDKIIFDTRNCINSHDNSIKL